MKKLFTLFLFTIPFLYNAKSQDVIIHKNDGQVIDVEIKAISFNEIITEVGYISLDEIDSIVFKQYEVELESTYKQLGQKTKVVFIGTSYNLDNEQQGTLKVFGPIKKEQQQLPSIDIINNQLQLFNKQRTIGKTLQLGGLGLSVVYASVKDSEGNLIPELAITGGVLSLIGFIVDLSAGNHIRNIHLSNK